MKTILSLLLLLLTSQAYATAKLSIWPIKLSLSPENKTGALHLVNKGSEPVNVQIYAKSWDMDENGKFIETDTGAFIFFPRLTTIAPGEDKAIRVGYNGAFPALEKPYRVYVQELPPIKKPTQQGHEISTGVQMLLKLSIPLFVKPSRYSPKPQLEITATDGLQVGLRNQGSHNILLTGGQVELFDSYGRSVFSKKIQVLQRVLPQRRLILDVPTNEMPCYQARSIELTFFLGEQQFPDNEKTKRFSTLRGCVPQ